MEIKKDCELEIERIKATVNCPRRFRCMRSGLGNIPPVRVYGGADLIQCLATDRMDCPLSPVFCHDIVFCQCPLRRYLALELNK